MSILFSAFAFRLLCALAATFFTKTNRITDIRFHPIPITNPLAGGGETKRQFNRENCARGRFTKIQRKPVGDYKGARNELSNIPLGVGRVRAKAFDLTPNGNVSNIIVETSASRLTRGESMRDATCFYSYTRKQLSTVQRAFPQNIRSRK